MVVILNEEGTEKLNVPLHVGEILWADWCDFQQKEIEYFEARDNEDVRDSIIKMMEAVMTICDIPGEPFSVKDLPYSIDENDAKLIDQGYFLGFGEEVSVLRLYAHLVTMVTGYKPEKLDSDNFKIQVGEEVFCIDQERAGKTMAMDGVTTGEAIEILEFQRIAREGLRAKRVDFGNMDFTLGLKSLAVLVRKPGEELPFNRQECDFFLNNRMNVFKDVVTVEEVLTLRFFLINSYLIYQTTQSTRFSSKGFRRKVQNPQVKQKSKEKRRRVRRLK
jgi:hypothetical protein